MFLKSKFLLLVALSFVTMGFMAQDAGAFTPGEIQAACEKARKECEHVTSYYDTTQPCMAWVFNKGAYAERGGLNEPNELYKRLYKGEKACYSAGGCVAGESACKAPISAT